MSNIPPPSPHYRFGPFELDVTEGSLSRNSQRVKLQDLPYRLLVMLVKRAGEIVTREEVRQELWPENTFVEFDNSLGVAVRKIRDALEDEAEAPRYLETIPRRGYRFLAPVVAPVTGPLVDAKLVASGSQPVSIEPGQDKPTMSAKAFGLSNHSGLIVALVLLMVGGAVYWFRATPHPAASGAEASGDSAPLRVRRSVAVLGFRNLPGRPEDQWLSPAFADMLNTELASGSALRMVSGEDVARAKRELPLADEDSLAKKTLERLRMDPGADVVVLGSFTPLTDKGGKRIRLDVRLQDTSRGETISQQAFVGSENDLFELVSRAGAALRESLGAVPVSAEAFVQARASSPKSPLAVKFYAEGRARLWAFGYIDARDLLIKAVAADPKFPLSHAALSETWSRLGYTHKARDEIERARSLSGQLGPEERLSIEGQYYRAVNDRNKAIDVYRKLFSQFPDNLDYGLRLADEQRWVDPEQALQTLGSLRHLPSPVGDDPRIDRLEARAWMGRDFSKVRAAAQREIQKGTAQGSREIVASAYGILCQTLGNGVSTDEAIQDCEKARENSVAAGDRDGEARNLNDFAGLYFQLGDLDRAEQMFREAGEVFRQVGDIEGETATSNNLGDISVSRGNLAEARRSLGNALPGYKAMEDKDGVALTLSDLAEVMRLQGNLGSAMTTYQQAKATAQEIDDKHAIGYVLNGIGEVLSDRGDLLAARKSYQEALLLRQQIGEAQTSTETQLALAQLSIEEHHGADAEPLARKCKDYFHQNQQADDELAASVVLINILVAESQISQADAELRQAKQLAAKSSNELNRLQFNLASAHFNIASANFEASRAELRSTIHEAHSHQLMGVEFEARLAIAELNKKSGQSHEAESDLLALEKAARGKGYRLLADKALSLHKA